MKKLIFGGVLLALIATNANAAERLDGCNPSAPENQSITGAVWKSKCLNAKVHAVWLAEYDTMTLAEAKKLLPRMELGNYLAKLNIQKQSQELKRKSNSPYKILPYNFH